MMIHADVACPGQAIQRSINSDAVVIASTEYSATASGFSDNRLCVGGAAEIPQFLFAV